MKLRLQNLQIRSDVFVGLLLVFVLTASASLATPRASDHGNYRGQCRQLTNQINHFEGTILPMAIQRGNFAWERATNEQVARLWNRRADLCPVYGAERSMIAKARDRMRRFNQMVSLAGRAALAYFTGGLSGGLVP